MSTDAVRFSLDGAGGAEMYPPLPVTIVDAEGRQVDQFSLHPSGFTVERSVPKGVQLFAKMKQPSGRVDVTPLQDDEHQRATEVAFAVGDRSPHEWMAWSTVRLSPPPASVSLAEQPGMGQAWFQLWELDKKAVEWRQTVLAPHDGQRARDAIQLELAPEAVPRALVCYLGADPPQVISLPKQTHVRVLLTTSRSLEGVRSTKVVIGSYSPQAEAVLDFLRKGSLRDAGMTADTEGRFAKNLLEQKVDDPLAATAAAYLLLRRRHWSLMPQQWLENLTSWFDWIPDAHLIRAASAIQRGDAGSTGAEMASKALQLAFSRGLPYFAEARFLIEDLLVRSREASPRLQLSEDQVAVLSSILGAFKAAGPSFGYRGETPEIPMSVEAIQSWTRIPVMVASLEIATLDRALWPPNFQIRRLQTDPTPRIPIDIGTYRARAGTPVDRSPRAPGDSSKTMFVGDLLLP